ncbi:MULTISPECIES: GPP34 family phosphoprotein [unclassified Streptomyces]|uniref:GOLPH3/VPS74 family protein n=1 Tax=unclassified Streptomyces TaxID=2593676 RepID=UPI000EF7D0BB|nr:MULTISPECIES: GPP34 family phosphoprotein [unclassified Streptomyces]MZE53247.1 GPP34 family phosphoprotein [Streptomyces sp. SID5770]
MTTAKDLFIIAMEPGPERAVGQGDLSLALAGAELIDLIGAGAVTVDGDLIVPGGPQVPDDRLLDEAAARLTRQPPYERIEDWLWRRGRDLSAAYQSALEEDGELTRKRSGRLSFGPERVEPVETPARRRAADRREEGEPVLAALASAVGLDGERFDEEPGPGEEAGPGGEFAPGEDPGLGDEAVTTVVAAVHDAVMELEAVRQRRTIESSAFANLWRGV